MNKILILGASGFLGNTLYKELLPYFDVYGTFCSSNNSLDLNQVFFQYNVEQHDILEVLEKTNPTIIISALKGDNNALYATHKVLVNYVSVNKKCRLLYISCYHVFDGSPKFPSFEDTHPLSESIHGKFKISVEKLIKKLNKNDYTILRIPFVLGVNSPTMSKLKYSIRHKTEFDVFPNLIINVTTASKIAQQVHFIINKRLSGIHHLGSTDVIHHEDLIKEIVDKISDDRPVFKHVYSSNEDRYLAILPKKNKLPEQYNTTVAEVIQDSTLNEQINFI